MMIQISGKSDHFAQKCYFYQKAANNQGGKVFKVTFWLKPNMVNSADTKPLKLEL